MARVDTPSSVMYATLKELGISNRQAAEILLNTSLTFDGRMLQGRIADSSQLSRRIVHTMPGDIPIGLFNNFHVVTPQLLHRVMERQLDEKYRGDEQRAQKELIAAFEGPYADRMVAALRGINTDPSLYRNMVAYNRQADLPREESRLLLHLMLFVITGCTGNPKTASTLELDYAANILGADFHTAQTVINATPKPEEAPDGVQLGLVRVRSGHIKAGSQLHVLSASGTEIGLLPESRHSITDVDSDVSRRHAYVWREQGRWFIRDLESTNGTSVISGTDGIAREVLPSAAPPVELFASDVICLGATTRFMVMPMLDV